MVKDLANDGVEYDLDAQAFDVVDLGLDDALGQPELRDAVDQNAAGDVERLEDGDRVSEARQFGGTGQAGRPGADDGHFFTGRRARRDLGGLGAIAQRPVGDETLQAADGHRLFLLGQGADLLALAFLRADPAADGRAGRWCA